MKTLFEAINSLLEVLATSFSTSYENINIIVYLVLFPMFLGYITDKTRFIKYSFIAIIAYIWVDTKLAFDVSVHIITIFSRIIGKDYYVSSVILCVILPILIIISVIIKNKIVKPKPLTFKLTEYQWQWWFVTNIIVIVILIGIGTTLNNNNAVIVTKSTITVLLLFIPCLYESMKTKSHDEPQHYDNVL
jgi:hypothetical protein